MLEPSALGVLARKSLAILPLAALSVILASCTTAPNQPPAEATIVSTPAADSSVHPASQSPTGAPQPSSTPPAPTTSNSTGNSSETERPKGENESCPGEECIEVAVAGDILLHPALWEQAERDGKGSFDFTPQLAGIAPYLAQADLSLCNLETPLAPKDGPYQGYPMFTVPQEIIPALKAVGYDGCTTASNHTMDAGVKGVLRTLEALKEADLLATGSYASAAEAAKPLITQVGSAKVAVIAGTYGLNGMREDVPWRVDDKIDAATLIKRAKTARAAGAEIVIVAIHDGAEYTNRPTTGQKKLYRDLAASGEFDFIYSHHTHSVLPIEKYKGTWIVYGLGNSVAKHATKTVLNREGVTVNMQFVRTKEGWEPGELRWAPHTMTNAPLRWCALPATEGYCLNKQADTASLKRTTDTVNAFGADNDGAKIWTLPQP
ncbi:metallophosphatase [Arthrobacter sp. MYb227]|uniref:CapA family protein n=1 Tax=Arthrobacter sp. MYb227 TaxID=1848601 RepID=UPI000CFCD1B0|nr:CapA family protein [Arthrobacter sp. MYb227]PQZ93781.1 metallophosphatase [Arthrobacter sp. MYb227]